MRPESAITYTLTVANAGPSAATSVVVTDALPANVTFISATGGGTTNASGAVFWPVIPALTNGASTNLSVTVLAPAGGAVTNTAIVGSPVPDPTPGNNPSAPVITLINAQADLSVTKSGPPTPVNAASNITYTLTVANAGPSAATSVVVTDALPANVTFLSATGGGTTNASGAVYWPTIPALTNGASTNLSVTVLAPAGGAVTNTAIVGSPIPDPTPGNNTSAPVITLINAQAVSVTKSGHAHGQCGQRHYLYTDGRQCRTIRRDECGGDRCVTGERDLHERDWWRHDQRQWRRLLAHDPRVDQWCEHELERDGPGSG